MTISKEELVQEIEQVRISLNQSIDEADDYENIYRTSVELDGLIEQFIVAGY